MTAKVAEGDLVIDKISTFVALMAAISVAVERVVELLKGSIPVLASTWRKAEGLRRALIQLLAVAAGALIAAQMPSQLASAIGTQPDWKVDLLVGLIASGGSGLWNYTLDIVRATKVNKELQVATSSPDAVKPQAAAAAAAKA